MSEIENVLSGIGRIRMLKLLTNVSDGLSVHQITKKTGINHKWVLKHFEVLKDAQLLTCTVYGTKRLIHYADTPRAKKLQWFFNNYREGRRG